MSLLQSIPSDHTVEWDIVCRHTRDMSRVLLQPKPWPLPQMCDGGKLPPPEEPASPRTSLSGLLPKTWESSRRPVCSLWEQSLAKVFRETWVQVHRSLDQEAWGLG